MDWFYVDNGERRGPVSDAELSELNRTGRIAPTTLVWREGWTDWRPLSETGSSTVAANGTAACVECGRVFATGEMIQYEGTWVCPTCKPIFFQKVKEGVALRTDMVYAGFWIRFVAKFIDGILLQVVNYPIRLLIGLGSAADPTMQWRLIFMNTAISMVIAASYSIFFVGKLGATPGKMALRLQVVTPSGGKVSYARACGRYFAELLSSITFGIGYIMVAFDEEKRALHDRICDTRVIRRNA